MCGVEIILYERVEESVLKWYCHVVRMDEVRLIKKIGLCQNVLSCNRLLERKRRRRIDCMVQMIGRMKKVC